MNTKDKDDMVVRLRSKYKLTLSEAKLYLDATDYNFGNASRLALDAGKKQIDDGMNSDDKQLLHG